MHVDASYAKRHSCISTMDEPSLAEQDAITGEQPNQLLDLEYWPHLDLGNELFNVDWLDRIPHEPGAPTFQGHTTDKPVVADPTVPPEGQSVTVHGIHEIEDDSVDDPKHGVEVCCMLISGLFPACLSLAFLLAV